VIIRPPVIKRLFAQSGNQCAFPTCRPPSWKVKPSWARFATSRARALTAPAAFTICKQRVRSAASLQVVAVDLRRGNFASSGSITETAALSFYRGGSIKPPRRFGMSRLGVSGKPGVRRVTQ